MTTNILLSVTILLFLIAEAVLTAARAGKASRGNRVLLYLAILLVLFLVGGCTAEQVDKLKPLPMPRNITAETIEAQTKLRSASTQELQVVNKILKTDYETAD